MISGSRTIDLVVLAADKNAEFAVRGLLARPASLGIRSIGADVFVHPERDPGCVSKSGEFLASFRQSHRHAMVVFDREGCGRERNTREELEEQVESAIERLGWEKTRIAAVVLDPELEIWVWGDSPKVDKALGWHLARPDLRSWLRTKKYLAPDALKPARPKEAMDAALRQVHKPRSSSIFRVLGETVSVGRCSDAAFEKFKVTLANWFPAN